MYFEYETSSTPDLNQEVDYRVLLSIISKLSMFALHMADLSERLIMINKTFKLMGALYYFENKGNREYLINTCRYLQEKAGETLEETGRDTLCIYANAFKTAVDIFDSKHLKYSEAWKAALKEKLKETRAMLQEKFKPFDIKLQKKSTKTGPIIFFKDEVSLKLEFSQPVDQLAILSITKKLSEIALQTPELDLRLERIRQTLSIMKALCHIHEGTNHDKLAKKYKKIDADGRDLAKTTGDTTLLGFAKALDVALDVLESKNTEYSDAWKQSLISKLNKARYTLRSDEKSIRKGMKKGSKSISFVFFDEQRESFDGELVKKDISNPQEKSANIRTIVNL